jgi:hypothetical protein
MSDFHHEIGRAEPEVLRHHGQNRDFRRWTDEVIRDHDLADRLRLVEGTLEGPSSMTEEARRLLLEAIETRYAGR